nr:reverse transcriptase domain-containing protein [Tanacetum cinerariifolium]
MHTDARNLIRECKDCQVHHHVPRNSHEKLTPIASPWPFYKWGIDIAGHFPEGPGKVKFLIVAIDYFTKWIEARPVETITGTQVKKFVWDNIVCRFGLPGEIVSDNEKQFGDNPFKDWCEKLNIRQCFAFVKHPQANGLVERANGSLREGIKARLGEKIKIRWKRKQGTKPKWKDITTPGFEAPSFIHETLSTGTTKQAMQKTEASSDLSGRDHTKSQTKEHTGLETAMDTPFHEQEHLQPQKVMHA